MNIVRVATSLTMLIGSIASAQWLNHPTPGIPRTPEGKPNLTAPVRKNRDGKPDLSGLWMPLRPRIPESVGSYASLEYFMPPGSRIPLQPWAEKLYQERFRSFGG